VYKRLQHAQKAVESLLQNEYAGESELIIFSDGPRQEADKPLVNDVRRFIASISGFKSVKIIEREKNFGLAESIISGVTEMVHQFGKVIVVEDDLITSKHFLRYMNEALDKYQDEERVVSIHGYCYPARQKLPETYFLRGADCWGWGTWKRGWGIFEADSQKLINEIKQRHLEWEFDWDGTYKNMKMLKKQNTGKINSWAIRWHASAFLQNKLTLYPGRSLVNNIGGDALATHTKELEQFETGIAQSPIELGDILIEENTQARMAVSEFFRTNKPSLLKKLRSLL
jgi:hypothetical protein